MLFVPFVRSFVPFVERGRPFVSLLLCCLYNHDARIGRGFSNIRGGMQIACKHLSKLVWI